LRGTQECDIFFKGIQVKASLCFPTNTSRPRFAPPPTGGSSAGRGSAGHGREIHRARARLHRPWAGAPPATGAACGDARGSIRCEEAEELRKVLFAACWSLEMVGRSQLTRRLPSSIDLWSLWGREGIWHLCVLVQANSWRLRLLQAEIQNTESYRALNHDKYYYFTHSGACSPATGRSSTGRGLRRPARPPCPASMRTGKRRKREEREERHRWDSREAKISSETV
jgi:hypothetical protein